MEQVRYKRGDTNPVKPGLVFLAYKLGKEIWLTPEKLAARRANAARLDAINSKKPERVASRKAYSQRPELKPKMRGYWAKYRAKNINEINRRQREKARLNKEARKAYYNRWVNTPTGRQRKREIAARHRATINGRIINSCRGRIHQALKAQGLRKGHPTEKLIGCSIELFKTHLQSMFQPSMSWNNYGTLWEIDHRTPLRSFNLADKKQLHAAFNWSNCQPMLISENRAKSDRLEGHLFRARELA